MARRQGLGGLVRRRRKVDAMALFFMSAQPSSWAVLTSWSGRSAFSLRGRPSSRRTRIREQRLLRLLESGHRLLPGHGRKISEELVQGIPGLQAVEKRLEGNASPHEDRSAPEDVGVAVNHGGLGTHGSLLRNWT